MSTKALKTIGIVVGGLTFIGGCGLTVHTYRKRMVDTCEFYENEIKKLKYEIIEKDSIIKRQNFDYLDILDRLKRGESL